MARTRDPILVVGGGLGGAAVALALARKGFRVCLLEQAPEFGVIGYGIQLGPNAFYMFDRLGVCEAVLAQSIIPHALLILDSVDARVIARIPTGASFNARFKRPYGTPAFLRFFPSIRSYGTSPNEIFAEVSEGIAALWHPSGVQAFF